MLILSRRTNECIHIGEDIFLTILSVTKNQVRLGFEAPEDVVILRREVYEKMLEEQEASDLAEA